MSKLTDYAYAVAPIPRDYVERIYESSKWDTGRIKRLCESHERLRLELQGAEAAIVGLEAKDTKACARIAALESVLAEAVELLRPFANGHLYFDEEHANKPKHERDEMQLNYYDWRINTPKVGDCRKAAAFVAEKGDKRGS